MGADITRDRGKRPPSRPNDPRREAEKNPASRKKKGKEGDMHLIPHQQNITNKSQMHLYPRVSQVTRALAKSKESCKNVPGGGGKEKREDLDVEHIDYQNPRRSALGNRIWVRIRNTILRITPPEGPREKSEKSPGKRRKLKAINSLGLAGSCLWLGEQGVKIAWHLLFGNPRGDAG